MMGGQLFLCSSEPEYREIFLHVQYFLTKYETPKVGQLNCATLPE